MKRRSKFWFLMYMVCVLCVMSLLQQGLASGGENVLLFDADGKLAASYTLGGWTLSVTKSGSDFQVTYQDFPSGITGSPVTNTFLVPSESMPYASPNELNGSYPLAQALPETTLYSFSQALRDYNDPSVPGISFNPPSGTYYKTIMVSIKASPATAHVEYRNPGGGGWLTGGNSITMFVYKDTELEIKSVDGTKESQIITVSYQIVPPRGMTPAMVDTDRDGYPDSWEIANGLNPFISDKNSDTDGDGVPDGDEVLRGSDPGDDQSMPLDTDGDGWPDFDEQLRGTAVDDPNDAPVARRLYEVEYRISGAFYSDENGQTPIPLMEFAVSNLASESVAGGTADASGAFADIRVPAGDPMVIRGEGSPHKNFVTKRYIPSAEDLQPSDVSGTWDTAAQWETMYVQMLQDGLVQVKSDFNIYPQNAFPLEVVEREIEILTSYGGKILVGSKAYASDTKALLLLFDTVQSRNQNMNSHLEDIANILQAAGNCSTLLSDAMTIYTSSGASDDETVEMKLATLFQGELGRYLAGLMLAFSYQAILDSGVGVCTALDPQGDMDGDGIANAQEVPTVAEPYSWSGALSQDSDNDGILDNIDNCPTIHNPYQVDTDGDGLGDVCDPDNDNDGLSDGMEAALGTSPFYADTDQDGKK